MTLDALISLVNQHSAEELYDLKPQLISALEHLDIPSQDHENLLKSIYKIAVITTHPKIRESYLRSYFRIYTEHIDKDGRGGSIIIEITKKCNKTCTHCYSKYAGQVEEMSDENLHRIIQYARNNFKHIFITGGEPTLDPRILVLAKQNPDIVFFFFTNASTIDDSYAHQLSEVGNLIPMIGIDGSSQHSHDAFRGEGSYQEVLRAIKALSTYNVSWGCITLVTETNASEVLQPAFVDDKITKGAFLLRYLEYTPVGPKPLVELILSGETYYQMEKRKKDIINSKNIYMQETAQKKCHGLLFFSVDGSIKNCFSFHYAHYSAATDDLETAIAHTRSEWTSYDWQGECPLYSDPIGFKTHLESLGWQHTSTLEEPYLTNPVIAQKLQQNYRRFLQLLEENGL